MPHVALVLLVMPELAHALLVVPQVMNSCACVQNNHHNSRLEWIVIWLIVVEVVVGMFELLGLFGLVGNEKHAR